MIIEEVIQRYKDCEKDLSNIDLSKINLTEINLYKANLSFTILYESILCRANLSKTNLYGATLSKANLSFANLSKSNLYGANLSKSNLYGADLSGADLSLTDLVETDLTNTNLKETCLDPQAIMPKFFSSCLFDTDGDYLIGYRTKESQHIIGTIYEPGQHYVAPWFSVCEKTDCHPGIYLSTLHWLRRHYPLCQYVKVKVLKSEILMVGDKYRAKQIWVLEDCKEIINE